MLLWVSLLLLAPVSGKVATAPKPVISLQPPWTILFTGETMHLTCNGFDSHSPQEITWYHNSKKESTEKTYEARNSGYYNCQIQDSPFSKPVYLEFSEAPLILHGPTSVFQGQSVVLRCRTKLKVKLQSLEIYKNGKLLKVLDNRSEFSIQQASRKDNGDYFCKGYWKSGDTITSNIVKIQVEELLLHPELKYKLSWSAEEILMTLTCETKLPSEMSGTQLQFRYFRNNQELRLSWSHSSEFQIPAKKCNRGYYSCSAKTEASNKWQQSQGVWTCLQVPLSKPVLTINPPKNVAFEGENMTFHCEAQSGSLPVLYKFYHDNRIFHKIKVPEREDSFLGSFKVSVTEEYSGQYHCSAENYMGIQYSKKISLLVKELLLHPELKYKLSWSAEEILVTLTCETQLPSEMSDTQLQFRFFRNNQELGSSWSHSSEFQIPAKMCNEGHYSCSAKTEASNKWQQSQGVWTCLQVPLSKPVLTINPPKNVAFEGEIMTFHCEAQSGSLPVLYKFYHDNRIFHKIKVPEREDSFLGSFKVSVTEEYSGQYHCSAENYMGIQYSKKISLLVKVPVSQPVLTLSPPEAEPFEGHRMTFYCEVQRGSLPILYKLYQDNVLLKEIKTSSRTAEFFRHSLATEHSGKYHCSAQNGPRVQSSNAVSLVIRVPVSQPVFTLKLPGSLAIEGHLVTLCCEVQRGSPTILFQFYHENTILKSSSVFYERKASFSFSLTEQHSGNYHCTADNGLGPKHSEVANLFVIVPVSQPVLTFGTPGIQAVEGNLMELHCETQKGSLPILYQFYHEDVILEKISAISGRRESFSLLLTEDHSGNYHCTADNGLGAQRSYTVSLNVAVPLSRPLLTIWTPRTPAVIGDVIQLHCEVQKGSSPILYKFYYEDTILGNSSVLSGRRALFNLSLTTEHSGNYSCEASNSLGAQLSEMKTLKVKVPVSCPVLTLRAPEAQVMVGDMVELHCESWRGSPPIQYQFYHEDVILRNSSVSFRGGVSFNLSLTIKHSGNYSCEADNGLGAQRSEVLTLSVRGLTGSRSDLVTKGVSGGVLSTVCLAAVALLFYYWLLRKTGRKPASDPSRSPSNSDAREPTYHNVPAWIELQPVYSNVNLKGGDVVYSEIKHFREEKTHAGASTAGILKDKDSSVIYSQVKTASTPASWPKLLTSSDPHR